MGRKKLEESGPPGSAARLRAGLAVADRFISFVTWGVAAGMIVWSMLNATPYVADHLDPDWRDTAFVLPLVVDLAFLGSLRADEIASRHNVGGGAWAAALRLFTGASSLFLNIGSAAEKNDWTGVFQHLITPGILVLLAEAGPVYRRRLARRLDDIEAEEAAAADAERARQEQEEERRRRQAQEDADREAERQRQEEEQRRKQAWDDELKRAELEEKREAARASREIQARRLDLEEKRLTLHRPAPATPHPAPASGASPAPQHPVAPAPAAPVRVPAAPVASAPRTGVPAPQPRTEAANGHPVAPKADLDATAADKAAQAVQALHATPQAPAAPRKDATLSVAAAQATAPGRVTARIEDQEDKPAPAATADSQIWERPAPQPAAPSGPVKDWDLPGLPADCAPGRAPELLTDAQVTARIDYGLTQGWTQRRVGEFAGRSATVVNRRKKERERAA
ncbi:hypothetical protein SAMN04490357_0001 [Streptomyces misionensis]|uniref:DUF2637 domain-containing protein n=1 Tax=Streptomyces misionensis TaxID=67331 RepID=A0A1H4I6N8_9ACTN|nr:hypothetical protein [Streptomyces misionensis]SEB29426.1 hypothetical protein SAMN04490357_0001 [Streptomyces misionensis]